jgi:hypothetical protein
LVKRRILAAESVHLLVTRFGPQKLRGMAFDEKYRRGDWCFQGDSKGRRAAHSGAVRAWWDLLVLGRGGASVLDGLDAAGLSSVLEESTFPKTIRLAAGTCHAKYDFK